MSLKNRLQELVDNKTLADYTLEDVSEDGEVGVESKNRNTERLTLNFPNGEKLVLGTFCSGCLENTCFTDASFD